MLERKAKVLLPGASRTSLMYELPMRLPLRKVLKVTLPWNWLVMFSFLLILHIFSSHRQLISQIMKSDERHA